VEYALRETLDDGLALLLALLGEHRPAPGVAGGDRGRTRSYWGTHTFLGGDLAPQQDEYPLVDYFDSAGVRLKC
jgi:hypothetical protein